MAGYNPYATNSYQGTQMFPQPQGNVYTLNNSMEIAKYAQYRLEHFMNFHKLFENEASKEKKVDKETVSECMWHETHEMFQHWYDDIERKIKKYS